MSAPVVELLAANPLFAELAPSELEALATAAERHEYSRDETVFAMQQPADGLYVLVSGRVKVSVSSSGGKEIIPREFRRWRWNEAQAPDVSHDLRPVRQGNPGAVPA